MQNTGNERLTFELLVALSSKHTACYAAAYSVFPELLAVEQWVIVALMESLQDSHAEAQILDGLEPEYDDGELNGGDLAGESVESRVGDFENLGCEGLVGGDELRHIPCGGSRVADDREELRDDSGQGGQPDDSLGHTLQPLTLLLQEVDFGPYLLALLLHDKVRAADASAACRGGSVLLWCGSAKHAIPTVP